MVPEALHSSHRLQYQPVVCLIKGGAEFGGAPLKGHQFGLRSRNGPSSFVMAGVAVEAGPLGLATAEAFGVSGDDNLATAGPRGGSPSSGSFAVEAGLCGDGGP